MIEITVLVFLILLFIKPLAKERGESLLKWSLITIGAWVGTEILFGAVIFFIISWWGIRFQSRETLMLAAILVVILINIAAASAAFLVIRTLRKKTISSHPVATAEQLT